MGGATRGDGKGTVEEKEGDRHPAHARSHPLFIRGCASDQQPACTHLFRSLEQQSSDGDGVQVEAFNFCDVQLLQAFHE